MMSHWFSAVWVRTLVCLALLAAFASNQVQAGSGIRVLPFFPKVPKVVVLGATAAVAAVVVGKAINNSTSSPTTQAPAASPPDPEDDESCIRRLVHDPELRREALEAILEKGKKLLKVPEEKHGLIDEFLDLARKDELKRPAPGTASYNKTFRKRVEKELGPPPQPGMDADHRVERCVGGKDCAATNSQWLNNKDNRACGSLIGKQVKHDPPGTQYHPIPGEFPRQGR